MAETFNSNWEVDDLMYVEVTGMVLTNINVRLTIEQLPKVDFTMNINSFLQRLSEEELDKIKKLIIKLQLSELKIGVNIE